MTSGTTAEIIDAETLQSLNIFTGMIEQLTAASWSSDGTNLAIVDGVGVQIWQNPNNPQDSERIATLTYDESYTRYIRSVAWNPVNENEVAVAVGAEIDIWNILPSPQIVSSFTSIDTVEQISWNPTGTNLASAGVDRRVIIWDVTTGNPLKTMFVITDLNRPPSETYTAAFSVSWNPDGTQVVFGVADGTVRIWDIESSNRDVVGSITDGPGSLKGHDGPVWSVDWNPTGDLIASGGRDGTVRIWNAITGEQLDVIQANAPIQSVAWNPEGNKLAWITSEANSIVEILPFPQREGTD